MSPATSDGGVNGGGERPDLATRLAETARHHPERRALVWRGRTITYAQLDERVTAAAAGLATLGVGHGDRVAFVLGNTPSFVEVYLGALRAGATAVPLNPTLTPREVGHILRDSRPTVVVAAASAWPTLIEALGDDRPAELGHLVGVGTDEPLEGATTTWDALVEGAGGSGEEVERAPDDVAALVYTSGTTGQPRGAMLTRRNLAANQDQVLATRVGLRPDDVVLTVLPLFHIYALNVGLGTALRVGATVVLVEEFEPLATLRLVEGERATVILGAPTMYIAWLHTDGADALDLSSVRVATSGAAPLPADVLRSAEERLGLLIWEGYGLTEAAPAVTSNAMADAPRAGSVGLPLPGVVLRLVDERGRDVEQGDPGRLLVRGENVFVGYWDDEAATGRALSDDGWLRTGDIGIRDDDGFLHLVDREHDLIIVAGFNVYPREVEEVLHEHPDIADAAVIGVPHPYRGESVKAFVVVREGAELTAEEVRDWSERGLARYKCPAEVAFVDALPYTATGKVRRGALREEGSRA